MAIADLSLEKAQAAAAEIGGPDVAIGVQVDVSDEAAVAAALDATLLAFGGVDLVVNNAGLSLAKSLLETSTADTTWRTPTLRLRTRFSTGWKSRAIRWSASLTKNGCRS